jgi:ATP-dependent Lon protease
VAVKEAPQGLELPEFLHLLPMMELNTYPNITSTICVDEHVSRQAVLRAENGDKILALFALKTCEVDMENLLPSDFFPVGVAAQILEVKGEAPEPMRVLVQGLCRISFSQILTGGIIPLVKIVPQVELSTEDYSTLRPMILEAKRLFAELLKFVPGIPVDVFKLNTLLDSEPVLLADLLMASIPLNHQAKAEYLLIAGLKHRYLKLLEHLTLELSNRQAGRAITQRIEACLDKKHREMHLREQIKAIQAELGEGDEPGSQAARDFEKKLEAIELPEEARTAATREIDRLSAMPPQSMECGVITNYLEWLSELPWKEETVATSDLKEAKAILDRDHYGLDKVKRRILEFLAVFQLTQGTAKTPILCLTGPPGVGKTSLGKSIAECLGRKFVRLSLGGLRDEAEIRGHRRAYVGARPGRVIAGLKKAGVRNPVVLLDELDKMATGPGGDPGAALLEALDPEQNSNFTDHFLELPFDLSKVLFILTANVLEEVPPPLRDRLEIIEVEGYSTEEKVEIAMRHLWPKELLRHGLDEGELNIKKEELAHLISSHTWEAGCRELTRNLSALVRSRSMAKALGEDFASEIDRSEFISILGPPLRRAEMLSSEPASGVVTGLAWTAGGGDIMLMEAVGMPGKGKLSLTGQLGDVMKESAQAAISYVRSKARDWGLDENWFKNHDIHVHLPQGAIPKDGPSAGVGLATAIVSLVGNRKVKPNLAMTGEISLRGLVLPVGGLREKLLAAKRAGIKNVLIPTRNLEDLKNLPRDVLKGLEITPVDTLDKVLTLALMEEKETPIGH